MRTRLFLLAIAFSLAACATAPPQHSVVIGTEKHTYGWVADWGKRTDGSPLGNTHGCVVVDSKGRLYVNTDTKDSVMVFSPKGEFLKSWGNELHHGLHGMTLAKEGKDEFLYLCHTARHQVLKTTLEGKVIWTLDYPKESGLYKNKNQFNPTAIAIRPEGGFFVADGYGQSWVHLYDADRKYVRSFGGRGKQPGKMHTPHGLFMDTRQDDPVLIVCDRENHRLQLFDMEGKHKGVVSGMLRRPCNISRHGSDLAIADLAGRVTILNAENKLVCHLGDNPDPKKRARNNIARSAWKDGEFLSPHGVAFDKDGNLFVADWNQFGRVTRLNRMK